MTSLLSTFRRSTSTGVYIPEVDGLRCVAVTSVYIFHLAGDVLKHTVPHADQPPAGGLLYDVTQVLNVGVPLFFVLSGFIIGLPFANRARSNGFGLESLKGYFLRRLTRIEPPYVISLILLFVLKILAGKGTVSELIPNFIASLFYVHNLVYAVPSAINFVAWSLEVEIQFYILAPLFALLFFIAGTALRIASIVAVIVLLTILSASLPSTGAARISLPAYAHFFLMGFLLVEMYLSKSHLRRVPVWGDLIWLAVSVGGLSLLIINSALFSIIGPWFLLVFCWASFAGPTVNRILASPLASTIGGMCYSIYLLHNHVVAGLGAVTERVAHNASFELRLLIQFLLITPFVLLVTAFFFKLVEQPCMNPKWPQQLRRYLLDRRNS